MKKIEVVAAIIENDKKYFATQRGYGDYKDWWEFPGGKIEEGETPEQALAREIHEELNVEIKVGDFLCTVDYDYPQFHLTMHCYMCELIEEKIELLEHEAAKWLKEEDIWNVEWLPADVMVVQELIKKN